MSWLHRVARAIEPITVPHLARYLALGQGLFLAADLFQLLDLRRCALVPALVLHGEWWRIFTFVFVPPPVFSEWGLLFAVLGLYLIHLYGTALEQIWGTARFNLFLFLGFALTIGAAFLTPGLETSNLCVSISLFLAFAYLNPELELLVFFVIPVRVKWIAAVAWTCMGAFLFSGQSLWLLFPFTQSDRLAIVATTINFLLFFSGDILRRLRGLGGSVNLPGVPRPSAGGSPAASGAFRHQCRVCKRTDASNPELDFRYCSKCEGEACYCSDHLRTHDHVMPTRSS